MKGGLAGLLIAYGVSIFGSRMSMLAVPWFVLATTGSPTKTGLVAFAEALPYVLASATGGPVLDRVGPRRVCIAADATSAVAVVLIPSLYSAGLLHFGLLVGLVAVVGPLRGFGDSAKRVVFPETVAASGVHLTRATSVQDGLSRLANLLGAPLAGVLIALYGAPNVLLLDAATFAFAAVVVAMMVPRIATRPATSERYLHSLRSAAGFIAREPLVRGVLLMMLVTNLFDAAYGSVLTPVWAREVAGSAVALGLVSGAFGLGAVLGNVAFTAVAPKVPRFAVFAWGFLVAGAPRFVVPAVTDALWPVYAVTFVAGLAIAAINPIFSAVQYERVPEALRARVIGLSTAVVWGGIPMGGLLGGWAVDGFGLRPAWLIFGSLYLLATLAPFVRPAWRGMDQREPRKDVAAAVVRQLAHGGDSQRRG